MRVLCTVVAFLLAWTPLAPLAAQDHSASTPRPSRTGVTAPIEPLGVRPDVTAIRWAPSTGRDCHVFHGRRMCEGPRRVPLLDGPSLSRAEALGLVGPRVAREATRASPPARWVEAARAAGARASEDLLWPVPEGRLWRGYGPRFEFRRTPHGLVPTRRRHLHQGVDIGARQGSVIVAVADGLVVYSDNRMSGYGNAVIVVHADGAVSLYAHCVETYVVPGQLVRRGQVIAAVGQTGIAHGPHLHFEFRQRGRTVDPYRRFTGIPRLPPLQPLATRSGRPPVHSDPVQRESVEESAAMDFAMDFGNAASTITAHRDPNVRVRSRSHAESAAQTAHEDEP